MSAPGRRAAAVALLAAALGVALAGPSVAARSATLSDGHPTGLQIAPADLPRSPEPTSLHVVGATIVDGRTRLRTGLTGRVRVLGRSGAGYVMFTTDSTGANLTLWRVDHAGTAQRLRRLSAGSADGGLPLVSADGRRVAYFASGRATTAATVLRVRDGRILGSHRFTGLLAALDFRRRVLLSGIRPTRTMYWDPVTGTIERAHRAAGGRELTAADVGHDRAVSLVTDPAGPDGVCAEWTRLSDAARVLWHSCTDMPLIVSPTGAVMLTTYINSDGLGPGMLQVRDSDTGLVRATLRTAGYFRDWSWESDKAVLLITRRAGQVAVVRFTLGADLPGGGTLQRVSSLVREAGATDRLLWSFPPG